MNIFIMYVLYILMFIVRADLQCHSCREQDIRSENTKMNIQ
jgi:hypothetical protein